jgi:hypothetical protein
MTKLLEDESIHRTKGNSETEASGNPTQEKGKVSPLWVMVKGRPR